MATSLAACRPTPSPTLTREQRIQVRPGALVVKNGTLIDGTGSKPVKDAAVVIEGQTIVAVGPERKFQFPKGIRAIDAGGGTILPGIINAHVHILAGGSWLEPWTEAGVTTVRDLGASLNGILTFKRLQAKKGNRVPTLVVAGPIITAPGGYPVPIWGRAIALEMGDTAAAREGVEQLLDAGVDIIKIAVTRGHAPDRLWPELTLEQIQAIVEVAHQRGTRVSAHVSTTADLWRAVEGGVDDAAHMVWDEVPDELIRLMVEKDVYMVPTLFVREAGLKWRGATQEQVKQALDAMKSNLRRFVAAGGKVALGNDFGNPGVEPGMPLREMELMVEAGMTPMQVIMAGTKHAAHVCNLEDKVGTIEPGKQADIIVVDGDPLQDISAMASVIVVIKGGEVIKAPTP
ncbi:MAG: amidohydrolase family protein [Anaerolineae bacterium]